MKVLIRFGIIASNKVDIHTSGSEYVDNSDPVFHVIDADLVDEGGNFLKVMRIHLPMGKGTPTWTNSSSQKPQAAKILWTMSTKLQSWA